MYLLGIERGRPFRSIFLDTGHEHPWTLDYIAALPQLAGGPPIEEYHADFADQFPTKRKTIREEWPRKGVPERIVRRALELCRPTGNRFLDLCILRGGFPSMRARFCTDRLKVRPAHEQVVHPILKSGRSVISWQGVRAEESPYRRDLVRWQRMQTPPGTPKFARLVTFRPLLDWTVRDVWRCHRRTPSGELPPLNRMPSFRPLRRRVARGDMPLRGVRGNAGDRPTSCSPAASAATHSLTDRRLPLSDVPLQYLRPRSRFVLAPE